MERLIFEGIRCFGEKRSIDVKPLTVLVGENSTGKSTFLAISKVATELLEANTPPNFNKEPFQLGSFSDIVHFGSKQEGPREQFRIGSTVTLEGSETADIIATFNQSYSEPVLSRYDIVSAGIKVSIILVKERVKIETKVVGKRKKIRTLKTLRGDALPPLGILLFFIRSELWRNNDNNPMADIRNFESELLTKIRSFAISGSEFSKALSPIRSRIKRTYDPVKSTPDPEGGHIPVLLSRISSTDPENWKRLKREIESFGKSCGLFEEIKIRKLDKKPGAPFQICLRFSGPYRNLIDIGYGVGQGLPILVDCLLSTDQDCLYIQQPEVHLHPRAQAQLGSFFASQVTESKKRIMIETHSDYLLDRIRMEVRDENIDPDDVSILFFSRKKKDVEIHEIGIDNNGNLLGAPPEYRQFFLAEEMKFLRG